MMWTRSGKENLKNKTLAVQIAGVFLVKNNGMLELNIIPLRLNREEETEFCVMVPQAVSYSLIQLIRDNIPQ